jgi:hypothetical protein
MCHIVPHCYVYTCTGRKKREFGWFMGNSMNINVEEEGRRNILKSVWKFVL